VWCPDWPLVAAGVADVPSVAVHANRVVACSAMARAEDGRRGLRRREAQGRCPELIVIPHDVDAEARAFEPVVATIETFTPRVEVVRPGVCAFATRGPSRYFGGDQALADRVAAAVPVPCRIGVADGSFASGLAARRNVIVPRDGSAEFLAEFGVRVLERPELADLLIRLGVRTLGDLAVLPATDVLARFGVDGAEAHRLASGLDHRPLDARVPPPDLVVQAELDPPAERVDMAAFVAKALADELHERLAALGLGCTRIAIEAQTEHGEHLTRLWRHDGTLTATAIAERMRWQLDGWLASGVTTAGVSLLRLVPDEVRPDHGRQDSFWGGATAADERAARGLARVQGMLGPDAVVTANVVGGRHPAEQVRLVPWGDWAASVEGATHPWPGRVPPPSPATVHAVPLPAEVVDGVGQPVRVSARSLVSGAPSRLSVDGGPWADIVGWAGPWPADERWWDRAARRRRARLQVSIACGDAHLLTVETGRWYVDATYD
jgi:protein ImuB